MAELMPRLHDAEARAEAAAGGSPKVGSPMGQNRRMAPHSNFAAFGLGDDAPTGGGAGAAPPNSRIARARELIATPIQVAESEPADAPTAAAARRATAAAAAAAPLVVGTPARPEALALRPAPTLVPGATALTTAASTTPSPAKAKRAMGFGSSSKAKSKSWSKGSSQHKLTV